MEKLSEQYTLLERDFVKNKLAEIENYKKQTLTYIKWILGTYITTFTFFISKDFEPTNNFIEIKIILGVLALVSILILFSLESRFLYLSNKIDRFYSSIKNKNYNEFNKIIFSTYEENFQFNVKNFPLLSFFISILSMYCIGILYTNELILHFFVTLLPIIIIIVAVILTKLIQNGKKILNFVNKYACK